ncbi:MAG TPA: DUF2262 domain-containing protein [Longimicrobium sp.]|nr:DUF2262 domain-containing protein [Longimicrobium sp.]
MAGLFDWLRRTFARGEYITGVVDPHGAGGGRSRPEQPWSLRFTLDRWRGPDGAVRTTPLTVRRPCNDAELSDFVGRIQPYQVLGLRVRMTGPGTAELVKLVGRGDDDVLAARAAELSARVTREDERFGTLTLNRRFGCYECETDWDYAPIQLDLQAVEDDDLEAALRTAYALWDQQESWSERIDAFAVQELLELKNDGWLGEGESPLTADEFVARMRLVSISVDPDGGFTFWHDDGDLFWGHSIQVTGSLADGPTHADTPG